MASIAPAGAENGSRPSNRTGVMGLMNSKRAWLYTVPVGLLGGLAAVVLHPLLLIAGLFGMAVLLVIPFKGHKVFWTYLLFLLLGYLLLGKGFAYVGVAPVYVAEIGLALAIASTLVMFLLNRLKTVPLLFRPEVAFLVVFIVWQAVCTIPYLTMYGADALRDAALWGYAAFALFILMLVPRESVDKFFVLYGRLLPYYLAWLLVAVVFVKINPLNIYFPGSPVPLLQLKSGDVGVHLAGAAAFMLLRLDFRGGGWSSAKLWSLWGVWIVNWVTWGASNRGGMFSALVGISIVLLWRPKAPWHRPLALATLMLTLLFLSNFSTPSFGDRYNEVSVSGKQIIENVTSTFGAGSSSTLQGTKEWRLRWWEEIVGYTFGGEYFWTGKGYGVNLANEDGFQVDPVYESVRTPHNVFMTILARSGVPGLILWLLFLASFGSMLVSRAMRSRRSGNVREMRYAIWLLAYWLAFLFNASFDVFLEGPMGGVWFWSIVGMSLVYFSRTAKHSEIMRGTPRVARGRSAIHVARR